MSSPSLPAKYIGSIGHVSAIGMLQCHMHMFVHVHVHVHVRRVISCLALTRQNCDLIICISCLPGELSTFEFHYYKQ